MKLTTKQENKIERKTEKKLNNNDYFHYNKLIKRLFNNFQIQK